MSAELMPFTYEGAPVRSVIIGGEPWFVVADAAKILGYRDASNAARLLRPHQQGYSEVSTPSGTQRMLVASEGGVNRLIMRSNAGNAEAVQDWFTDEVLPTIRKTGGAYIAPGSQAELDLTDPDTALDKLIEVAQVAKAERARRLELEAKVEADAPKVEAYEQFMEADGTYLVGTVARMLGTSQNKLFEALRERAIFIPKGAMRNTPYQRYMQHFTVKATHFERSDGSEGVSYTTRVKPSGVDFIRRRLNMQVVAS